MTEPQARLFSYGTLQLEAVQKAIFGRRVEGTDDRLTGYHLGFIRITEAEVLATSGQAHHPIAIRTEQAADYVDGRVLAITLEELERADTYEVSAYRRVRVELASGSPAWAYVDAESR